MYFQTKDLAVGYNGKILIHDINVEIERGKILTLIGPNGAGKSTILKSITRHLRKISGLVYIDGQEIYAWSAKEMAKQVAVVLTEHIKPELMTCEEVVAMGRYPYTNAIGRLTSADRAVVREAMRRVHAEELAEQDFTTLSDGQRQRIMLARAIAQEPEIIILDEPTSYLDIRHKIELLNILREMAREKGITVIMSLHEIDLATKISDYLLCVKGDTISAFGAPEEIMEGDTIDRLYEIQHGSYNLLFGSVELTKPEGDPRIFVVGGGGRGIEVFRWLQKCQKPFATGILFDNDVDYQVASKLSDHVVAAPAFQPMTEAHFRRAVELLEQCQLVIDAGTPIGEYNHLNQKLLETAEKKGIPVCRDWKFLREEKKL